MQERRPGVTTNAVHIQSSYFTWLFVVGWTRIGMHTLETRRPVVNFSDICIGMCCLYVCFHNEFHTRSSMSVYVDRWVKGCPHSWIIMCRSWQSLWWLFSEIYFQIWIVECDKWYKNISKHLAMFAFLSQIQQIALDQSANEYLRIKCGTYGLLLSWTKNWSAIYPCFDEPLHRLISLASSFGKRYINLWILRSTSFVIINQNIKTVGFNKKRKRDHSLRFMQQVLYINHTNNW